MLFMASYQIQLRFRIGSDLTLQKNQKEFKFRSNLHLSVDHRGKPEFQLMKILLFKSCEILRNPFRCLHLIQFWKACQLTTSQACLMMKTNTCVTRPVRASVSGSLHPAPNYAPGPIHMSKAVPSPLFSNQPRHSETDSKSGTRR